MRSSPLLAASWDMRLLPPQQCTCEGHTPEIEARRRFDEPSSDRFAMTMGSSTWPLQAAECGKALSCRSLRRQLWGTSINSSRRRHAGFVSVGGIRRSSAQQGYEQRRDVGGQTLAMLSPKRGRVPVVIRDSPQRDAPTTVSTDLLRRPSRRSGIEVREPTRLHSVASILTQGQRVH